MKLVDHRVVFLAFACIAYRIFEQHIKHSWVLTTKNKHPMATEADDDLQLIRASGGLLADLQTALSNLLWKRGNQGHVHHLVRSRDLDHVIQLVHTH
jgi:hypothetical protein